MGDETSDVFSAAVEAEAERLAVERAVAGRGGIPESVARDFATIAARTALAAPGVRAAVTRRNRLGTALCRALADGEAINERLAAALADANGKIAAVEALCAAADEGRGTARDGHLSTRDVRAALAVAGGATEGTGE